MEKGMVIFSEEDTLFRLMETALNNQISPPAEKALHYFFGSDIHQQVEYLTGIPKSLKLPASLRGKVCEDDTRLGELVGRADFLVVERAPITREILQNCRGRLKFIQKFGANCMNIDLQAAREMSIQVANLVRLVTVSVSEHVVTAILALARRLLTSHHLVLERQYSTDPSRSEGPVRTAYNWGGIPVQLISGKSLGILGLGEVGFQVAKRAHALGMRILYHDALRQPEEVEREVEACYTSTLMDLAERSDFLTLHVPYGPSVEKVINSDILSRMKTGSFLINTSRGGLVDERALYRALLDGRISGAALDVYRWEPVPPDSLLLKLDNVLWSTHNAGGPAELMLEESRLVLENIARVIRGEEASNRI